jgi:hypothetical protein
MSDLRRTLARGCADADIGHVPKVLILVEEG